MKRRDLIKNLGLLSGAAVLPYPLRASNSSMENIENKQNYVFKPRKIDNPIKVITIGAGSRGNVYGDYRLLFPDQMEIVGVAEPIPERNRRYAEKHNIQKEHRFETWEHVFDRPKFADAVIISTPDNLHYGPCMAALKKGYDILLEKPIAPTAKECMDILALAKETGRIVAVCHVLRYAPYFVELKKLISSGAIGELISIDHFEPIEHTHMAHSYVRGNWHNSKETTPIILAKSCHDMDIMRWMVDQPCDSIAAYGDLKWFKRQNAPEGSTPRCTDGCAIERNCPYSAKRIYLDERKRTYVFELPKDETKHEEYILEQLRTTNYGRCVYRMDNDQPDHYVTSMRFKDGVTANFSMEAFTSYGGRRTRIMGAMGDIVGDMHSYRYTNFITGEVVDKKIEVKDNSLYKSHGGGDVGIMIDWILAVSKQDASILTSTIDVSIESHMMCFKAEESRLNNTKVDVG